MGRGATPHLHHLRHALHFRQLVLACGSAQLAAVLRSALLLLPLFVESARVISLQQQQRPGHRSTAAFSHVLQLNDAC
jgi:hypothetical protein